MRYKGLTLYQADWSLAAITIQIENSPKLQIPIQAIPELGDQIWGTTIPIKKNGENPSQLHNNCSVKHISFLTISKTIFHNGTDAFLATPDGYRNEGAVWMNNIVFVTLDAPVSQDLPYKYHFWDISGGGEPVLTHALECTGVAADCASDASVMMVQGE